MIVQSKIALVFGMVSLTVSSCFAVQSGSRSVGATGGSASRSVVASPAPPTLQPAFSSQQNFGPATSSSPAFSDQSQLFPQGQPFNSVVQGQLPNQSPNQFETPAAMQSATQPATGGSGKSSIGIPESSLVDPVFGVSDRNSNFVVDNSAWNRLLAQYMVTDVQGINRLRYRSFTAQDKSDLKGYLRYLQSVDPRSLNRDEQLAFWFNLYNARTVDVVLDSYPIRSIRQIKMKFTDFVGPFDDPGSVCVLGKPLSLNDIESGIIRPVWKDPRIHYALNCASYGCPNLAPQAWTAANLDARLNGAAYQYINSNRAIRSGVLGVRASKIFKWYKDDFGGSDQSVLEHIRQYANPSTQLKLQGQQNIVGHFYDWSLNDGKITRRRWLEPLVR